MKRIVFKGKHALTNLNIVLRWLKTSLIPGLRFGRVKIKLKNAMTNRLFRKIISAFLIGIMSFLLIKPTFVQAVAGEEDLSLYVTNVNVDVGTKVSKNGFRQIKYTHRDKEYTVTDENYTNADPETDGDYITWMSQIGPCWQIFLHHITSGETVQLTTSGNNVNPSISGNYMAWEGQVAGVWQVFIFDGIRIIQVTEGDMPSLDVKIEGDYVVYGTKVSDEDNGWTVSIYDIATTIYNVPSVSVTLLTPDGYGYAPDISEGIVTWDVLTDGGFESYLYDIESQTTAKAREWFKQEVIDVKELDDADEQEEAVEIVESPEVVESESEPEGTEVVPEEPTAEEEESLEEPEQFTEEEVMEELGIVDVDIVLTEEVEESTPSEGSTD